jgi:transposase
MRKDRNENIIYMKHWREKIRGNKPPRFINSDIIGKITPLELETLLMAAPEPYGKSFSYQKIAKLLKKSYGSIKKIMHNIRKRNPKRYAVIMTAKPDNKKEELCEVMKRNSYADITERETQLLLLYAPGPIGEGLSISDIAKRFNILEHEVKEHFKRFSRRNPEAWRRVKSMRRAMAVDNTKLSNPMSMQIGDSYGEEFDMPCIKLYHEIG